MPNRDHLNIESDSEDEVEVELVDLSNEDEQATGPVDFYHSALSGSATAYRARRTERPAAAADTSIHLFELPDSTIIRPGDTVELKCPPHRQTEAEPSGDYLRIEKILKDDRTDAISIQGYRLIREKYILGKDPTGKGPRVNELVQHLVVQEDDDRPAAVQGLERVSIAEVVNKRDVVLTDKPYPMLGFRDQPSIFYAHLTGKSKLEQKRHILQNGPLVCRWTRTSIVAPNGRRYSGIYRRLSKKDSMSPQNLRQHQYNIASQRNDASMTLRRHGRTLSLEEVSTICSRRRTLPSKVGPYSFVDVFCGDGGASRGADNAGLKVVAGLDHDELAMEGWEKNNPGAISLCMDAFVLLNNKNYRLIGRCDFLNISNPCQPYSAAHTRKGQDDEINIKQLETIKPLIEGLMPRVVVLENTAGLANIEKNRKYFSKVLNDMRTAGSGYNLRWKIVNMADYGLPQERKRLIIIAAKKDTPLPPFPMPTHGPPGSGLKPYVSIGDALAVLDRFGHRAADKDFYHKSHKQTPRSEQLYDPFSKLVDCIMTGGVNSTHWSGEKFTPRELALLQSLPHHHHLAGSWSQAIKQIGNMFPPVMAELIYRTCAQTLEAFDHGFIEADEEIYDLNITLLEKGINTPEISSTPTSLFDLTGSSVQSPYRYLSRPVLSDAAQIHYSSAFAKRSLNLQISTGRNEKKRSFTDSLSDEDEEDGTPCPVESRRKRTVTGLDSATDTRRSQTLSIRPRERPMMQFSDEDDDEVIFMGSLRKTG